MKYIVSTIVFALLALIYIVFESTIKDIFTALFVIFIIVCIVNNLTLLIKELPGMCKDSFKKSFFKDNVVELSVFTVCALPYILIIFTM